jgi:hypothetical protein
LVVICVFYFFPFRLFMVRNEFQVALTLYSITIPAEYERCALCSFWMWLYSTLVCSSPFLSLRTFLLSNVVAAAAATSIALSPSISIQVSCQTNKHFGRNTTRQAQAVVVAAAAVASTAIPAGPAAATDTV